MNDALHDDYADDYDAQASAYGWFPEAVFGLCYEFIKPGERLLDLGIGSGLGSLQFARLGLQVTGVDESGRMLEACRNKGFAHKLEQWDLARAPWRFHDGQFDHVLCLGVLHFFERPEALIGEAVRVLRSGGLFTFTTNQPYPADEQGQDQGDYHMRYVDGVKIYCHSQAYIKKLLDCHNLEVLKRLQVLVGFQGQYPPDLINVCVSRKTREDKNG